MVLLKPCIQWCIDSQ